MIFFIPVFLIVWLDIVESDILIIVMTIISWVVSWNIWSRTDLHSHIESFFLLEKLRKFDDNTGKMEIKENFSEWIYSIIDFILNNTEDVRWSKLSLNSIQYNTDWDWPYITSILPNNNPVNIIIKYKDIRSLPRIEWQNFEIYSSKIKTFGLIRNINNLQLVSSEVLDLWEVESIGKLSIEKSLIWKYDNLKHIKEVVNIDDKDLKRLMLEMLEKTEQDYEYNDRDDDYYEWM